MTKYSGDMTNEGARFRKLILFLGVSVDGFIARKNGGIDWLEAFDDPGEDYGYARFVETVDTVIMGRKSYDKMRSFGIDFPHRGRKCYVMTRSPRKPDEFAEFYSGEPRALVESIRSAPGRHIYLEGGAEVANAFLREDLVDELVITTVPFLLGSGIRLFQDLEDELGESQFPIEKELELLETKSFPAGLVQAWYRRIRS